MAEYIPWSEYPRPQLQRDSFFSLNGTYSFAATSSAEFPKGFLKEVQVPYPVESGLSGVGVHFPKGTKLWYRRFFTLPSGFVKERVYLNCGGIDQVARIFVNGIDAGTYITAVEGPVHCDISDFLQKGENELLIMAEDDLDSKIPYGKQKEKHGGMWYTPFSGIYQSIWLESVPEKHVERLVITPSAESVTIRIIGEGCEEGSVECEGKIYPFHDGCVTVSPEEKRLWTPDFPYLYYFTLRTGEDEVDSYFALRSVSAGTVDGNQRILVNGSPVFLHGLLDQGYFEDGLVTPKDESGYRWDILCAKRMGFNTLRKHIKIEPEVFYYECDRVGMFVMQDMVNNGTYSFFKDTLLPTLGLTKEKRTGKKDAESEKNFLKSMESTVERLYNHPSILLWTVFNEGWGQSDATGMYEKLKSMDPTRLVDTASGWFEGGKSDVVSRHVYFKHFRMPEKADRPVLLSEFGGYVLKVKGHAWNPAKTYGYAYYRNQEDYRKALERLYMEEIIPAVEKGLCGAVYTQLGDVEDETNGLVTYDRKVVKPDEEAMRAISARLRIREKTPAG